MRILITGANGQLGCELVRLIETGRAEIGPIPSEYEGAEVVCTDRTTLDIASEGSVEAFFSERGPFDLVVNCAAMTNVDGCESDTYGAYRANAWGPWLLARACERDGAKLVQVSTDYVFSGDIETDRVETDETEPLGAYGGSKLAGEQLVARTCPRHFIVRTAWLYGYEGANFVKTMLRLARERGAIKVVADQKGNPTSANDLAYEILKIALGDDYGIYHCTGKGTCSWYEFAVAIVDGAGIECSKTPCTTEEFPRPARRPAYSSLENRHLADTIGDEMRPWQDALTGYLANMGEGELL